MFSKRTSSRLLIIATIFAFAISLTLGLSYTNDTGADLDFESTQQTVDVLDAGLVTNITISIEFLKTDGTCLAPNTGFAFHRETVFSLMSPAGTIVNLVNEDTYSGGDDVGTLIVVFDDTADSPVAGVPVSGTFQPVEALSTFNDEVAGGIWTLFIEDTVGLDPLCVFEWTLNVEAVAPNSAPVAEDFELETLEDEAVDVNFLDHVSDDDGDELTIEILTEPSNGTLEVADDETVSYTPEEEWAGVVSFDYLANDGELDSEPATVHIVVLPVNDAPNCDAAVLSEDVLWPPNHREVTLDISGITDVDSTIITTEFTDITSNEAVNGTGDGNTDPDWSVDDGWVRAERSGNGNGRVYSIAFSADDEDWTGTFVDPDNFVDPDPEPIDEDACEGTGAVIVPHDRRGGVNNLSTILSNTASDSSALTISASVNIASNPTPGNSGNNGNSGNSGNNGNGGGKGRP